MPDPQTHYGDEDPEGNEPDEEELFQIAKQLGNMPEDFQGDSEFAARYAVWLKGQA
jgi:hypothetical protein